MRPEVLDYVKKRKPSEDNPPISEDFSADVPVHESQQKRGAGSVVMDALTGALAGFAGGPDAVLGFVRQRQAREEGVADRLAKAKEFALRQKELSDTRATRAAEAEADRQARREVAAESLADRQAAREESRLDRKAMLDAARQERMTTREMAAADKTSAKQEKASLDEKELNVPGWDRSADIRPTSEEAKVARKGLADFDSFASGIEQLKGLIRQHGSTNLIGKGSNEAGSLATGLKLTLKNIAQLGVMSASDADLLAQQIINPNEMGSMKISDAGALEQLDATLKQAREKMEAGMASKGYSRRSLAPGAGAAGGSGLTPEQRRARIAELKAKLAAGGQ